MRTSKAFTQELLEKTKNNYEEAVNLVQYQQMYQANMKVISVANTLFDATLQMVG